MDLKPNACYHLYNRSNDQQLILRETENYLYFLRKFRNRFENMLTVLGYCLMPTHFHYLVRVDTDHIDEFRKQIGILLSSYTKAFNNYFQRHGSLFQQHTKAKHVKSEKYLMNLLTYIHQNPVRAGLVDTLSEWSFSSYPDLAGYRNGTLVDRLLVNKYFSSIEKFRTFSNNIIPESKIRKWH